MISSREYGWRLVALLFFSPALDAGAFPGLALAVCWKSGRTGSVSPGGNWAGAAEGGNNRATRGVSGIARRKTLSAQASQFIPLLS
jgi:hypothetical protein